MSPPTYFLNLLIIAFAFSFRADLAIGGSDLTDEQIKYLPDMSSVMTTSILNIVTRVEEAGDGLEKTRRIVQDAQESYQAIQTGKFRPSDMLVLFQLLDSVRKELGINNDLREKFKPLQDLAARLEADAEQLKQMRMSLEELQNAGRREIEQRKAEILNYLEEYSTKIEQYQLQFKLIVTALKSPAKFATGFLEDELVKRYMNKPYEVGGELTFRFVKSDPSRSIFSEDGGVTIVADYGQFAQIVGEGLYFEYQKGVLPKPVFDKIIWRAPSKDLLAQNALALLSGALPDVGITGVNVKQDVHPPVLILDVGAGGILSFAPLELKGQVRVSANGKVEPQGLGGDFECGPSGYPISPTVSMYTLGGDLSFAGSSKSVTVKTQLAPTGSKDVIFVDAALTLPVPFDPKQGIKVSATCTVVAVGELAKFKGLISADGISGHLWIPGDGPAKKSIEKFIKVDAQFALDHNGLTAEGMARLFSAITTSADLALRFDGSGHFDSITTANIGKIHALQTINTRFDRAFTNLQFSSALTTEVDLKVAKAEASIEITMQADDLKKSFPKIYVKAAAHGVDVTFEVHSIDDITPDRVAIELQKKLGDILNNVAEAAAKWEKDKKELLAKWAEHWRDELSKEAKRIGIDSIKTGNDEVDAALSELSKDLNDPGRWASNTWKKAGKEASDFVKNPKKSLEQLPSNAGRELANGLRKSIPREKLQSVLNDIKDVKDPKDLVEAVYKYAPHVKLPEIELPGGGSVSFPPISIPDLPWRLPVPSVSRPFGFIPYENILKRDFSRQDSQELYSKRTQFIAFFAPQDDTGADTVAAAILHLKVEEQLQPLVTSLKRQTIVREVLGSAKFLKAKVELSNCVAVSEGDGNGSIGIALTLATIERGSSAEKVQRDTKPSTVTINFRRLFDADGSPSKARTAEIIVDPLLVSDKLDLAPFIREFLAEELYRTFTDITIQGTKILYEKRVALSNLADHSMDVSINSRSWSESEKKWQQREVSLKVPANATGFIVREEGSSRRDDLGTPIHASELSLSLKESQDSWPGSERLASPFPLVDENPTLGGIRAYVGNELGITTLIIGETPAAKASRIRRDHFTALVQLDSLPSLLERHAVRKRLNVSLQKTSNGLEGLDRELYLDFSQPNLKVEDNEARLTFLVGSRTFDLRTLDGRLVSREPATAQGPASVQVSLLLPQLDTSKRVVGLSFSNSLGRHSELDVQAIAHSEIVALLDELKFNLQDDAGRLQTERQLAVLNLTGDPLEMSVQLLFPSADESLSASKSEWFNFTIYPSEQPKVLTHPLELMSDGRPKPLAGRTAFLRLADAQKIEAVELVQARPDLGGVFAYESTAPEVHTHVVESDQAPRISRAILYREGEGYFEHAGRPLTPFKLPNPIENGLPFSLNGLNISSNKIPDNWSAQRSTSLLESVVQLNSIDRESIAIGYHHPVTPWKPTFRLQFDGAWKLGAWAEIMNNTPHDWRNVELTLRTGTPKKGEASTDWQSFEVGRVSVADGARALVPLTRNRPLPISVNEDLVYRHSPKPSHPRRLLSFLPTSRLKDVMPGGTMEIYDGNGFRFATELKAFQASSPKQRVEFPDTDNVAVLISPTSDSPKDRCETAWINCGVVSFTVTGREHTYLCSNSLDQSTLVQFEIPGDDNWTPTTAPMPLTPQKSTVAVLQSRKTSISQVVNFRDAPLKELKARVFQPDEVQKIVLHVIAIRESIEGLISQQRLVSAALSELASCNCRAITAKCPHAEERLKLSKQLADISSNIAKARLELDLLVHNVKWKSHN